MASAARDLLDKIRRLRGAALADRIAEACAGRTVRFGSRALSGSDHPFRKVLDQEAAAQLVADLTAPGRRLRPTEFPFLRGAVVEGQRARAILIRKLIAEGRSTCEIARQARVSPRTVWTHRAKLRGEAEVAGREGSHVG